MCAIGAGDDEPVLSEADVLAAIRASALPASWRMRRGRRWLRLQRGHTSRRAGALVCLCAGGTRPRLAWRRVVKVRGDRVLLRASAAPRADGWWPATEILATVVAHGVVARVAARIPDVWTSLGWAAACGVAMARTRWRANAARWASRAPQEVSVRRLSPAEMPLVASFDAARGRPDRIPVDSPAREPQVLGAFDGERLVGLIHVAWPSADACYSHTLFVDPAYRGLGIAASLKRAVLLEATRHGATRAQCLVHARNFASVALNAKVGWRWTGQWLEIHGDPFAAMDLQLKELEADLGTVTPRPQG